VRLLPLLLGIGLTVASCAENGALEQDVAQLRQDVNQLLLNAHRGRGEAEALSQIERATREQKSESARQMSALSGRIESINSELTRLAERVDQTSQRLDNLGQRIEALSRPVVPVVPLAPSAGVLRRSQSPASPPATSAAPPPPPGPSASPAAPTPQAVVPAPSPSPGPPSPAVAATPPTTPPASAEAAYQAAYLDFSKGNFALAIPAFREFVRRFPDSPLADSAQYAIGESHFSMARAAATAGQPDKAKEELEQAVQEFRKVIVNYPRGSKVPTALYKEALALAELKQTALAQARLEYLLQHFPQSEEAPLAKERLAALKQ
jgi:tol-pal system protein YbgF